MTRPQPLRIPQPSRLRIAREALGLSMRKLASAIGVSAMSVSKWEAGKCSPGHSRIPAIAKALNVSMHYLLSDREIVLTWRGK